jgi:hypothetical protein
VSLEKLEQALSPAVYTLLREDELSLNLVNANIREDATDGELYRAIRSEITIPPDLLTKVYATKYAKHFYSEVEISRMIQKWSQPRKNED